MLIDTFAAAPAAPVALVVPKTEVIDHEVASPEPIVFAITGKPEGTPWRGGKNRYNLQDRLEINDKDYKLIKVMNIYFSFNLYAAEYSCSVLSRGYVFAATSICGWHTHFSQAPRCVTAHLGRDVGGRRWL
jgi:hypothetical protein